MCELYCVNNRDYNNYMHSLHDSIVPVLPTLHMLHVAIHVYFLVCLMQLHTIDLCGYVSAIYTINTALSVARSIRTHCYSLLKMLPVLLLPLLVIAASPFSQGERVVM